MWSLTLWAPEILIIQIRLSIEDQILCGIKYLSINFSLCCCFYVPDRAGRSLVSTVFA